VSEYKQAHALPLYVPARESELLAARRSRAEELGVDPALVEDLLRRMMRESYAIQEARFPRLGPPNRSVVIVGAKGALGSLMASFFQRSGHQLRLVDREQWPLSPAEVEDAALLLLSVPIDKTVEIIKALPLLPEDCVLADLTSVKRAPLQAMLDQHPGPVVGLHPMFGPDTMSLAKQVVVVCEGRDPVRCQWVLDQIHLWGAVFREESAVEHDKAMELVQAMRHFSTLVYGAFLAEEEVDLDALLRLSSPIYRLELAMVGRLFAQGPELYADIMLSAKGLPALVKRYQRVLIELLDLIEGEEREQLIGRFSKIANFFGPLAARLLEESGSLLRKAQDIRDPT